MASIVDLDAQAEGSVSDDDLILTHQPVGSGYVGKSVRRDFFLKDVPRTDGDAAFNSVTVAGECSSNSMSAATAEFTTSIRIGAKLTKLLLSAAVTEAVSAAAGASDTIAVPLVGAIAGDFVLLKATGLTPGIFASGVAGTDAIAVTIFNATASPFADDVTVTAAIVRMEA